MINPRTNATAKTPKSATEKCEGSIFEEKNRSLFPRPVHNMAVAQQDPVPVDGTETRVTQRFSAHHGFRLVLDSPQVDLMNFRVE